MRVVIATDRYPALSSAQAGAAMASAWAELRAQVAVVPMGNATEGFQQALADLLHGTTHPGLGGASEAESVVVAGEAASGLTVAVRPRCATVDEGIDTTASSHSIGRVLREVVDTVRSEQGPVSHIVLELGDVVAHDGGAGLLAALGAMADRPLDGGVGAFAGITHCDLGDVRDWLADARLSLVVPAGEVTRHLVGLKGITSLRGHRAGLDPALLLATDQALVDLADAVAGPDGPPQASRGPGGGAAGGIGHAVLALGGEVVTGAAFCRDLADLSGTIGHADLVVTGGGQLDFGTMGGDVLATVVEAATDGLRPVIVVAQQNFVSPRELRSIGVEAAYSVRPDGCTADPVDAAELSAATRPIAASWCW